MQAFCTCTGHIASYIKLSLKLSLNPVLEHIKQGHAHRTGYARMSSAAVILTPARIFVTWIYELASRLKSQRATKGDCYSSTEFSVVVAYRFTALSVLQTEGALTPARPTSSGARSTSLARRFETAGPSLESVEQYVGGSKLPGIGKRHHSRSTVKEDRGAFLGHQATTAHA